MVSAKELKATAFLTLLSIAVAAGTGFITNVSPAPLFTSPSPGDYSRICLYLAPFFY